MRAGRVLLIVFGVLIALIGAALAAGGGTALWAYATQRDDDGFFTTRSIALASPGFAVVSDEIDLGTDGGAWQSNLGDLAEVRVRATSETPGRPLFVGIGPEDEVAAYLEGVAHTEVRDVHLDPVRVESTDRAGSRAPGPPGDETFWAVEVSGTGTQTLTWEPSSGRWSVVVMNADTTAGVRVDADFGVRVGILRALGIGTLIGGLVLLGIGITMIAFGARGRPGPPAQGDSAAGTAAPVSAGAAAAAHPGARPSPLRLTGGRPAEGGLSRWLWLVKWLLGIPHFILLAFLWLAYLVLTVVAFFAILITGRYPEGIFRFNLGVLRWSWRVAFWSYSALGTDRYPPFSLGPEEDYPATLHLERPERLSRGRVLVKWWLLALPHYLVVGVLTGSGWAYVWSDSYGWLGWGWGGLIGLLVLFAGVALLFTGRYPRHLFDLVVGLNRWVFRVITYAGLMRDEYPPFRLDQGPDEPAA